MTAIDEIAAERRRQIEKEGWSLEHDDGHEDGALALAACCYAAPEPLFGKDDRANGFYLADPWPWDRMYDKRPYDGNVVLHPHEFDGALRRDLLIKAGALIVAEIERLDRKFADGPSTE